MDGRFKYSSCKYSEDTSSNVCSVCDMKLSNASGLARHMHVHTGEHPNCCHICGVQIREQRPRCLICGKQFSSAGHLRDHILTHDDSKAFVCGVCGKQFARLVGVLMHMSKHIGDQLHLCLVCNKQFTQPSHLNDHLRIHTGENPYCCAVCEKRFTVNSHVKGLMRIHSRDKPYVCGICGERFCWAREVRRHIFTHVEGKHIAVPFVIEHSTTPPSETRRSHSGEKHSPCDRKVQIKLAERLQNHARRHFGSEPQPRNICAKQFKTDEIQNSHMRILAGSTLHICDVCGLRFVWADNLLRHKLTHTAKKS